MGMGRVSHGVKCFHAVGWVCAADPVRGAARGRAVPVLTHRQSSVGKGLEPTIVHNMRQVGPGNRGDRVGIDHCRGRVVPSHCHRSACDRAAQARQQHCRCQEQWHQRWRCGTN